MNQPPNILWICTDQQRWDTIRAPGNPHVHTPDLDRLVNEDVAFTCAYCQSSVPSTAVADNYIPARCRTRLNRGLPPLGTLRSSILILSVQAGASRTLTGRQ